MIPEPKSISKRYRASCKLAQQKNVTGPVANGLPPRAWKYPALVFIVVNFQDIHCGVFGGNYETYFFQNQS